MSLKITPAQMRMLEAASAAADGVVDLSNGFERRTASVLHDMGLGDHAGARFQVNPDGQAAAAKAKRDKEAKPK